MRLRTLLLSLLALVTLAPSLGCSTTTPTEARAIAAAQSDHSAYTLPPAKLAKATSIARFYDALYFVSTAWGILSLFLILRLGIAARMSHLASSLAANRWAQSAIFLLQLLLLITLLDLPLRLWAHHASVGFGFSIQPWLSWSLDQAKSFLLTYAIAVPAAILLFYLVRRFPRRWWLWLWFPTIAFVLFSIFLTPLVIDPLFYKFELLTQSNPDLVQQLEAVAAHGHISIPPGHIFLMKASEKTTLLNAYVTGFGSSKRLVLYDTLLAKAKPEEILIIAGHEMGHYVLGHILRGTLIAFAGILAAFFVGFHLFQFLLRRFGPRWHISSQDDWAAAVIILLVLNTLVFFAEPIGNAFSRSMEHDADVFGQEVVHGVTPNPQATGQATEQMLGESYFADPNPSPFVEFWTGSHPTTSFRAAFAKHYDPWAPNEQPKFFPK